MNIIKKHIPPQYRGKILGAAIIMLAISTSGIMGRVKSANELKHNTDDQLVSRVTVVTAKTGEAKEEIILPGNVVAWHEASIFARTNGYIKKWLVDIGTNVKKGDLLAVIEIPEVEAQLRQAEADLNTAIANYNLAQSTAIRWEGLLKTRSVSKQDNDEKASAAISSKAIMNSAKAKRDSLKDLVSFKNVIAPFDGTISNRRTDIGTLINEGSSTTAQPLFNIVQANRLRVYVKVPQNYSSSITPDMIANLTFSEHPGKKYPAKLLETAKAIDPTTRTLLTEFEVDNTDYTLLSGGYTQVHLTIPAVKGSVILPVNTLIFRSKGLQVATVDNTNKVTLQSITIARDFGTTVEVDSGIKIGQKIIINPSDALVSGTQVEIMTPNNTNNTQKSLIKA